MSEQAPPSPRPGAQIPLAEVPSELRASVEDRMAYLQTKISFHQAARDGQLDIVRRHITNFHTEAEKTATMRRSPDKIFSELINELNEDDIGAIHFAARYGRVEVIEELGKEGANLNIRSEGGMTPLTHAAKAGQVEAAKKLVELSVEVNGCDDFGYTALHWAAAKGHGSVVRLLMRARGIAIDQQDNEGITPLQVACTYGFTNIAQELMKEGANVNATDHDKNSVLHCCCDHPNSLVIAQQVLKRAGDEHAQRALLELRDSDDNTALHTAVMSNLWKLAKHFLECGADPNGKGQDGKTPLHFACLRGNIKILQLLIRKGASVEAQDNQQQRPLHIACQYAQTLPIVKILLKDHQANIEAKDKDNFTPLMFAAWKGQARTVAFLLARGANVDAMDGTDKNALHHACEGNHMRTTQLLLSVQPTRPKLRDDKGQPMDFDPISTLHKDAVPNLLSWNAQDREFTFHHVKVGQALEEQEASSGEARATVAVPKQAEDAYRKRQQRMRWVDEPTSQWGITWLGFVEVWEKKGGAGDERRGTVVVPGVASYDPAGVSGDVNASERVGDDYAAFQLAVTLTQLNLIRRGGGVDEVRKIQEAAQPLVERYHRRLTLFRYMLHQVEEAAIHNRAPKPYPAFVLELVKAHELELLGGPRAHARTFLRAWTRTQGVDAAPMETLLPPLSFFKECRAHNDPQQNMDNSDIRDNTPLHVAAECGHKEIVAMLLGRGADVTCTNDSDQTPLHLAAMNGHLSVAGVLIRGARMVEDDGAESATEGSKTGGTSADEGDAGNILEEEDDNSMTPLHYAAKHAHKKMILLLLESGANLEAKDIKQWTALHWACSVGSIACVRALVDSDSNPNEPDKTGNTPLHEACRSDDPEIVKFLLDNDAVPTKLTKHGLNALDVAVEANAFEVAKLFTSLDQDWFFEIMANTNAHDKFTVMGRMIARMPKAAVLALNRCVSTEKSLEDKNYEVVYRYDLVDRDLPPNEDPNDNTSLELMVKHQQEDVMNHPVIRQLLEFKWRNFGRLIFYLNLVLYMLFLACITAYVLVSPVPRFSSASFAPRSKPKGHDGVVVFVHVVIVAMCVLRLFSEASQLVVLRLRYFGDYSNYIDLYVFVGSLAVFGSDLDDPVRTKEKWQWDMLVFIVFFSWIVLVVFVRRIPGIGMYVLMFQDVVMTFSRAATVFALFLVAFSLSFFVLLQNTNPNFRNIGDGLLKTLVMLVGEFEYEGVFNVEGQYTGLDACAAQNDSCGSAQLPSPSATKFLFAVFVVLMPLLLLNLLVGLAVGDIQEVREKAELMRLSMQTHLVTDIERRMGSGRLRDIFTVWVAKESVFPNRPTRNPITYISRLFVNSATRDAILEITQGTMKTEREELMERVDVLKDEVVKVKKLVKDIDKARKTQEEFLTVLQKKLSKMEAQ